MKTEIKNATSFATLFVTLAPGETVVAEAQAMASRSSHLHMTTHFAGGLFRALIRRFLGKESLFVNHFTCPQGALEGEVVLTQPFLGDMLKIDLNDDSICLQPGAFVACGSGVRLRVNWAGFASFFNGDGLFRLEASGVGPLWVGGFGGISVREMDGEFVVDSGHLLGYAPTVGLSMALAGGIFSSFFGGEGIVTKLRGRGRVLLQSRSLKGMAHWTNGYLT